jgi:hypothetical protein
MLLAGRAEMSALLARCGDEVVVIVLMKARGCENMSNPRGTESPVVRLKCEEEGEGIITRP